MTDAIGRRTTLCPLQLVRCFSFLWSWLEGVGVEDWEALNQCSNLLFWVLQFWEMLRGWKDKSGVWLRFLNPHSIINRNILYRAESTGFIEDREVSLNDIFIINLVASTVHSNSYAATQKQNNWMWFWFGNSQSTTQTQEPTTTSTAGKLSYLLLVTCLQWGVRDGCSFSYRDSIRVGIRFWCHSVASETCGSSVS